jgi:hypothetical protein
MATAISKGKKVESTIATDLYALALCCYLLLGDRDKLFYRSLSEISLPSLTKDELVTKKRYTGAKTLKGLIEETLQAA